MSRLLITLSAIGAVALIAACETPPTAAPMRAASPSMSKGAGGGTCTLANGNVASTGFDQYGYNRCAHNFVGTFGGWCAEQGRPDDCGGVPGDTRLNMKWNEGWDVGNATGWKTPPYDAWLDNEIRGDGFSEHFKTRWDATCAGGSDTGTLGGPCIWGPFEILMDQGMDGTTHVWWTKLSPAGFGS